jgi:hypothetical protein
LRDHSPGSSIPEQRRPAEALTALSYPLCAASLQRLARRLQGESLAFRSFLESTRYLSNGASSKESAMDMLYVGLTLLLLALTYGLVGLCERV